MTKLEEKVAEFLYHQQKDTTMKWINYIKSCASENWSALKMLIHLNENDVIPVIENSTRYHNLNDKDRLFHIHKAQQLLKLIDEVKNNGSNKQ